MPKSLSIQRYWFGYSLVLATVLISFALWIGAMWQADELYDNPWKYPAKVGSHGTLILMCWAFILATRFRIVEQLFGGLDKVYKAHRYIGETAFFLIFLHPIFLAVAFAESPGEFFRYLWFSDDWVRNTGLIALICFIVLVVLSIFVKIAYHRWKRTHDFFGVLLIIVVIHAVLSGGEIMRYPVLTFWNGFWIALGLSAYFYIRVLYRFVGPQYDYVTKNVRDIGDNITEVLLEPRRRPLRHEPGQFVYISFDADAVSEEPHPFSISSAPETNEIRLSIKRLGDWTKDVERIKAGEPARIWGPYGHFSETVLEKGHLPAVMIGGGIGITPFLSIVASKAFAERSGTTTLIYSVAKSGAAVYGEELKRLGEKLPDLHYQPHNSDKEGFIDRAYLENMLEFPLDQYLFLLCGPGPMMEAFEKIFEEAKVRDKQIISEAFDIR